MSQVFIALQLSDDSRAIVQALLADNPHAVLEEQPAMVRINAEQRLTLKRESVAEIPVSYTHLRAHETM
jgi:phenol hydroxylase P2 protein